MAETSYGYIIVGGGLAGAWAVTGIRELDQEGSILLLGRERFLPYNRPPLSKKLWLGQKKIEDIFVHNDLSYAENGVDVRLGTEAVGLDPLNKTISDSRGDTHGFEKLLIATGGVPRTLDIPGRDISGICYYRYLDDYVRMRIDASQGKSAVIVGGGFIGSELAAALNVNGVDVTMVFPEAYIAQRIFPESFGRAIMNHYPEKGVKVFADDIPTAFEKTGGQFITHTRTGRELRSDILLVGAGITPNTDLAQSAGMEISNGIVANEHLQTSHPDIYAAGDNAFFPYAALGQRMRIEHWDNALNQGLCAGRNMAGAGDVYDHMPYFWSDLFEYGYEAVGDIDSNLQTFPDWIRENHTGVIYYIRAGSVVGVMTCNIYGKMDAVREVLTGGEQVRPDDLKGIFKEPSADQQAA